MYCLIFNHPQRQIQEFSIQGHTRVIAFQTLKTLLMTLPALQLIVVEMNLNMEFVLLNVHWMHPLRLWIQRTACTVRFYCSQMHLPKDYDDINDVYTPLLESDVLISAFLPEGAVASSPTCGSISSPTYINCVKGSFRGLC